MAKNYKFTNKTITGVLSVVPKNCVKFMDEIENYGFSKEKSINLMKTMGFKERRIVSGDECGSDLCLHGMEYLFENNLLEKDEIGAIIYITQTPDHFMPPTSSIIHGKLELDRDVLCFDINQGCTGYIYGLIQAFLLLQILDKKILLLNADTLSRRACKYDRNIYPIIGDAGTITVIENDTNNSETFLNLQVDGKRSSSLIIPAFSYTSNLKVESNKKSLLN